MAFKMKFKNLKEVVSQLESAVQAHGKQAEVIKSHIKEMEDFKPSPLNKSTPCWDTHTNIVNGKQIFKKKGDKMVPDCRPK